MLSDSSYFIPISLALTLAFVLPVSAFLAFKLGYKTGRAVRDDAELPKLLPHIRAKPDTLTIEQQRMNDILVNIETYDGTSEGQVKV